MLNHCMMIEIQVVRSQWIEEAHLHDSMRRQLNYQLHQKQEKHSESNNTKQKRKRKRMSTCDVPDGIQHTVKMN